MQNFFKFEQGNKDWMPQLSQSPAVYQYNPLSFGQQATQTTSVSPMSASNGLMNSNSGSGATQAQPSELQQFLNDIGKGGKVVQKLKNAYDEWKAGQDTTPPTSPLSNVSTTPQADIMSGNNGLLSGVSADPYANVNLTPPSGLISGDNGILSSGATADPYANAGGFMGNVDFSLPGGGSLVPGGSTLFDDGTVLTSDGTELYANMPGETATTGSGNMMSGAAPYLRAGAGALGFGLAANDFINNGPSIENVGGMMSGGLAAASPWVAGAGPAAAVIAIPVAFKSIFGHKHKAPDFNDSIENITPFKKDDAGNIYMKMPGHGNIFRYNPTTNRYQVEGHRGGEYVGMGGDNMTTPTYGGQWSDLPVYEHNGQYYLRPSGGKWGDFYNISPISEYTQASVTPNDNLDNIYNSYIDASRTQQEADNLWNSMHPDDTGSYI